MENVLAWGGFIALIVVIVALASWMAKQRTKAMRLVAQALKLEFAEENVGTIISECTVFDLFSRGRNKKVRNVIFGVTNDIEMKFFDYEYVTGHGKHRHNYYQTVMMIRSSRLALPQFTLRPERIYHKIGSALGYQDIDFEENKAFSRKYLLRGNDEAAIRKVFSRDVLSFYEYSKGLCTEGAGTLLVLYRAQKKLKPARIQEFMQDGFKVFGHFTHPQS